MKSGELEVGVCRYQKAIWGEVRMEGIWFYILYEVEGKTFYTIIVKAGSMCLFLGFVGANMGKFTNVLASFYTV